MGVGDPPLDFGLAQSLTEKRQPFELCVPVICCRSGGCLMPSGVQPLPVAKGSAQVVFTTHRSLPLSLPISRAAPRGPWPLGTQDFTHPPPSTLPSSCSGSHQLGAGLGSHSGSLEFTSWSSTTALPHQEGRAGLIAKFLHDLWLLYPQNRWASQGPIF